MTLANDTRPSPSVEVRAAAEHWFARMRAPDCTPEERRAFLQWRADPDHRHAYLQTEQLWQQLGDLTQFDEMRAWSQRAMQQRPRRAQRKPRLRALAALAATMLLCVGLGSMLLQGGNLPFVSDDAGRHAAGDHARTVALPDGSTVTLNVHSEIELAFTPQTRALQLRKGEAVFEVHPDASRPFVVDAGLGTVQALGTRFMVRRHPQAMTVTHLQGRIAVDPTGAHARLLPEIGEELRWDGSGVIHRRAVNAQAAQSWTTGRLVFNAVPLHEALDEVNRYTDVHLRVNDAALSHTPISGTVSVGNSRSMARALAALLQLDVQETGEGLLLAPAR